MQENNELQMNTEEQADVKKQPKNSKTVSNIYDIVSVVVSAVAVIAIVFTFVTRVLVVSGADLMDGTPIFDIKPYIPYADCHPDAAAGFTAQTQFHHLTMVCDAGLWARVPAVQQAALQGVLENDPRPSYQHDPERVYGMEFGGLEVHFKVDGEVLTVTGIDRR